MYRTAGRTMLRGGDATATTAFLVRISVDAAHRNAYRALINGLVGDGVFGKLDALYLFCTADTTTAKLNLVQNAYNCTAPNGNPTFTADTGGFTGNGTTLYLDSLFNASSPSAGAAKYVRDSASMFFWSNTSAQSGGQAMGLSSGGQNEFESRNAGNAVVAVINGPVVAGIASTDGSGFWVANRTNSTNVDIYRNGNTTPYGNGASTSTAVQNATMTFFVGSGVSARQLFGGGWGSTLTATDTANLYARMHAYLQTIAGIA